MVMKSEARKLMQETEEVLQQAAAPATERSKALAAGAFGGDVNGFTQDWRSDQWPVERLKRLGGAYAQAAQMGYFTNRKSNSAGSQLKGFGRALLYQAALQNPADQMIVGAARMQGMPDGYDDEAFEKEFGFTNLMNARERGVGARWMERDKHFQGEVRKTALAENSGQAGGYIIPPQFMNELLTIAAEDGFIENRCKVIPMNSRTAQWPMLDITTKQATGTTPYYGGILATWQAEASSISETEPQFRQTDWTAWDLVLYAVSSNQLLADNGIGLDALLTQLFGQAITWYKEYAYLQGLGAGSTMPLGVINAPATIAQTRNTASHFLLRDAAAMMSHLQIRSWNSACWIMHQSVLPDLIQMNDISGTPPGTAGNHLQWISPIGNGEIGGIGLKMPQVFLNGLPLFFTEKLPQLGTKGDVMLVDWSRYVVGMRLDLQIDVSPHFLFRNNQIAWRVIARADGKPWLNSSITDQAGFTISPFVVLN